MTIPADPLHQNLLLTAEKKFWRCVESGETPQLLGLGPTNSIEADRIVDMSEEFAGVFHRTRSAP